MPALAMTVEAAPSPVAYFGKLPARGDFIGRRFERGFVERWDAWLGAAVLASKERLGAQWLDLYLTSPAWRFVLPAGAAGARGVAGVMIPSVDRVGRYFPLMLGVETAVPLDPGRFGPATAGWFQALEDLAIATLADGFDLADLDRPIAPMPGPDGAGLPARGTGLAEPGRVFPLPSASAVASIYRAALGSPPAAIRHSLWWTLGSRQVPACAVLARDLPDAPAYTAFLNGAWSALGWPVEGVLAPAEASDGLADWERDLGTDVPGPATATITTALVIEDPAPVESTQPAEASEPAALGTSTAMSIDELLATDDPPAPIEARARQAAGASATSFLSSPTVTTGTAVDIDDILPPEVDRDEAAAPPPPTAIPHAPSDRERPASAGPADRSGRWPTDD